MNLNDLPIEIMYRRAEQTASYEYQNTTLNYKVYLLSNASCRQHDYWPRVPAAALFDGKLVSCDVKLIKPMPEIYLCLYQKFGLKADECFFIDDNTVNVEAAIYTGMHAVVFFEDIARLRRELNAAGVPVKQL